MITEFKKEIGNRIKCLRIDQGVSQRELAKALGLTQANISNYERGACTPNIEPLIGIANFFHVSLDYICGRYEEGRHQFLKDEVIRRKSSSEIDELGIEIPKDQNLFEFVKSNTKKAKTT